MGSRSAPPAPRLAPPPPRADTGSATRKKTASSRSFRRGLGVQQTSLGGVTDDPNNQRKTLLGG
jgi:hypothetical protein